MKLKRASINGPDGGALAWKQRTSAAMPEQPFDLMSGRKL